LTFFLYKLTGNVKLLVPCEASFIQTRDEASIMLILGASTDYPRSYFTHTRFFRVCLD